MPGITPLQEIGRVVYDVRYFLKSGIIVPHGRLARTQQQSDANDRGCGYRPTDCERVDTHIRTDQNRIEEMMKTAASILVVGLYALPFATNAADE